MKLTKKLFIAIMTMALLVVTFSASTFAWFTLGQTSEIQNVKVNVKAAEGMEISEDGTKWTNNISFASADAITFTDLTSQNGVTIKDMQGVTKLATSSEAGFEPEFFEFKFYVRITANTENNTTTPDYDKVILDYVMGKDAVFTTADDATAKADGEEGPIWLSDATVTGEITENHYYRFDALNAVKISFQVNGADDAKFIYGYENSNSKGVQGEAVANPTEGQDPYTGLAYAYAKAKDFNIGSTVPAPYEDDYVTYEASESQAGLPAGFVKYGAVAQGAEKAAVIEKENADSQNEFYTAAQASAENGILDGITLDDHYMYTEVVIRVWLEGWDADCINAILDQETVLTIALTATND